MKIWIVVIWFAGNEKKKTLIRVWPAAVSCQLTANRQEGVQAGSLEFYNIEKRRNKINKTKKKDEKEERTEKQNTKCLEKKTSFFVLAPKLS